MPRATGSISGLGPQLKEMREALGLGQVAFAKVFDVKQSQIARWETGDRPMPLVAVLKVAEIAPPERKDGWLRAAGISAPKKEKRDSSVREVRVLRDSSALGTIRATYEEEIEFTWEIPQQLIPVKGGVLQAIRVPDDGMSPILERGFVAVIDITQRDPRKLVNSMVVTRDKEGVAIRWLRRDMGLDLLIPNDLQRHTMQALETGRALAGAVVLWTGKPEQGKAP